MRKLWRHILRPTWRKILLWRMQSGGTSREEKGFSVDAYELNHQRTLWIRQTSVKPPIFFGNPVGRGPGLLAIWIYLVMPIWGIQTHMMENLAITATKLYKVHAHGICQSPVVGNLESASFRMHDAKCPLLDVRSTLNLENASNPENGALTASLETV